MLTRFNDATCRAGTSPLRVIALTLRWVPRMQPIGQCLPAHRSTPRLLDVSTPVHLRLLDARASQFKRALVRVGALRCGGRKEASHQYSLKETVLFWVAMLTYTSRVLSAAIVYFKADVGAQACMGS